jgi:predicted transcriptional regulator
MSSNTLLQTFLQIGLTSFDLDLYQKIIQRSKQNDSISVTKLANEMNVSRVKIYQTLHLSMKKN